MVADEVMSSNVMFEGDHVTESIDEALSASEGRRGGDGERRTNKDDAADFLRSVLAGGAVPVLQIEAEARSAGLLGQDKPISQNKAFRSAREMLGIAPQRRGGTGASGQWVWELPAKMPSEAYDAPSSVGGIIGTLAPEGHLSVSTGAQ
jgi:hypothetical protein